MASSCPTCRTLARAANLDEEKGDTHARCSVPDRTDRRHPRRSTWLARIDRGRGSGRSSIARADCRGTHTRRRSPPSPDRATRSALDTKANSSRRPPKTTGPSKRDPTIPDVRRTRSSRGHLRAESIARPSIRPSPASTPPSARHGQQMAYARATSSRKSATSSAAGIARASGAPWPAHCAPKPNSFFAFRAACSAFPDRRQSGNRARRWGDIAGERGEAIRASLFSVVR